MKIAISPIVKTISNRIKNVISLNIDTWWEFLDENEDENTIDFFINVRNNMLDEFRGELAEASDYIYNQYDNESSAKLFARHKYIRLRDFSEFISENICSYFTVEECADIKEIELAEISKRLINDMDDIVRYLLKKQDKTECEKELYRILISENL